MSKPRCHGLINREILDLFCRLLVSLTVLSSCGIDEIQPIVPQKIAIDSPFTIVIDSSIDINDPVAYDLSNHLGIFYDTAAAYEFDAIIKDKSRFTPFTSLEIDNPTSRVEDFWLVLEIQNHSEIKSWYIAMSHAVVEYFIQSDEGILQGTFGINHRLCRPVAGSAHLPILCLDLEKGSQTQIYFRASRKLNTQIGHRYLDDFDRKLVNTSYISHYDQHILWLAFLTSGVLITVFIYHFVLFFFNRNRTFLFLALAAFSLLLMKISYNGWPQIWLKDMDRGTINDISVLIAYIATGVVMFPFSKYYLNLRSEPSLNWCIDVFMWLWVFLGSATLVLRFAFEAFFISANPILASLLAPFNFIQQIFLLMIGVLAYSKRKQAAVYYLLGLGPWFIIHCIYVLNAFAIIEIRLGFPRDIFDTVGFLIFSIGLAKHFQSMKVEHQLALQQKELADEKHVLIEKEARQLKELDQQKTLLYTNITHEFRTPLTVISGIADQIEDHASEKKMIRRNAQQLLDLVNQMLELNKIEAGQSTPDWKQRDIVPFLKYLSESYQHIARHEKKKFSAQYLVDTLWMDIDISMLGRILHNLFRNAFKFTSSGGQINVRLAKDSHGKNCLITIEDTGMGIPPQKLDKIFDRFYQVDNSTTRTGKGTGIGLALAKELAELMGGAISVSSQIHRGSTFTVSLPIGQSAEIESWTPPIASRSETFKRLTVRETKKEDAPLILIVEDHGDVHTYLQQLLTNQYRVLEADNGKSGLSMAFKEIPDLIISDIMMPEMDGYEFCQEVKADPRTSHIPVILLTAKSSQDDRLEGFREGADAYLIKPFDQRELFIRVEKLLESREKMREQYQRYQMLPEEQVKENHFLTKIRKHIEANLTNEHYQLNDLAETLHLGRTQIYRKLKALTGRTFTELVKDMKIHRAKELLANTDKSVTEVAFELGFKDSSYFSKMFKRATNYPPSEYRNRMDDVPIPGDE